MSVKGKDSVMNLSHILTTHTDKRKKNLSEKKQSTHLRSTKETHTNLVKNHKHKGACTYSICSFLIIFYIERLDGELKQEKSLSKRSRKTAACTSFFLYFL